MNDSTAADRPDHEPAKEAAEAAEMQPEALHIEIRPAGSGEYWNAFAWISPTQRTWIGYFSGKERARQACVAWINARWGAD